MAQHPDPHRDNATPDEPNNHLDDQLRAEEPPLHEDDTNPSRPISVSDILAAEEPPIHDEDTTPTQATNPTEIHGVEDRLRAEEPPIHADDTNPSQAINAAFAEAHAPSSPQTGNMMQRMLGVVMLLGAVALTVLAGYIWLESENDDPAPESAPAQDNTQAVADAPTRTPTLTATAPATAAPRASDDEDVVNAVLDTLMTPTALPTAAVDEIAAALINPIAASFEDRAIARGNEPFTIRPGSTRTDLITYTVQDGDTLESIAERFDLDDYYTLVWSNPSHKYNPLRPGVELNIPPVDGVYYEADGTISIGEIAQELGVDPYTIIDSEYNNLFGSTTDTLLVEGMRVMVPGGEAQRDLFFVTAPTGSGNVSGGVVTGTYSLWGCTAEVSGGTAPYGRPLESYTYMQGFRVGGHTGVDIAPGSGTVGDPIYASGGGTVVYAGWADGGYGNVAVIAHGSVFSLYAHMNSQPNVSCGQQVSQGTIIGQVGSSGNSSGPHLHFEVRDANFNLLNPASFVGF